MQTAKLGDYHVSRLICAGNPFGGYAHGGDLVYLGRLFRDGLSAHLSYKFED